MSHTDAFTYKVESHHLSDEDGFALIKLKLLGYASKETHPANWEYEMLVLESELDQWKLGSFKRIGIASNSRLNPLEEDTPNE